MAVRYDIQLTNNDLLFRSGDFVIGESDQQHCIDTINAFPGWWKENPLDGVGIMAYSKSPSDLQTITQKMRIELSSDNYSLKSPSVTLSPAGQMIINPNIDLA